MLFCIIACIVIKYIIVKYKGSLLFVHLSQVRNMNMSSCVRAAIITVCIPRKIKGYIYTHTKNIYTSLFDNIERECLSACFSFEQFHSYIYGCHIAVQNDHKPLEMIQKKTNTCSTPHNTSWQILKSSPKSVIPSQDHPKIAPFQDHQMLKTPPFQDLQWKQQSPSETTPFQDYLY